MTLAIDSAPLLSRFLTGLREEVLGSPLQTVGTLLGIANTILLIRRSIWNWPVGIASVGILGYVFFKTQLLSDTLLQIYFIIMQVIGWIAWLRHQEPDGELIVERMTAREILFGLAATTAGALALGATMGHYFHAAYPFWDATVASASVIGQLLLTWRRMENWLWWIGSNLISITIYNLKGLHILAGLYAFYMVMSVLGFVEWRKKLIAQRASPAAVGSAAA
jgi:nicotinamide mononucleotide transporter